jgi:hypothetical protein
MGKSYKHYDNGAQRPIKSKRDKAKKELKELPSHRKEEEDPYNSLKVDFDDEYNFEKFKRRR